MATYSSPLIESESIGDQTFGRSLPSFRVEIVQAMYRNRSVYIRRSFPPIPEYPPTYVYLRNTGFETQQELDAILDAEDLLIDQSKEHGITLDI